MRTVYVDVLIVVNMVIDWIMLLSAGRLLKLSTKPRRVLLGGAAGSVCSLAALLPKLAPPVNLLLDIGFAALMVFTAYGRASPKNFFIRTLTLFAVSFSFCGAMIFICTVFHPSGIAVVNDVVYFNINPVVLILLTLCCFYSLKLFSRITRKDFGKRICLVSVKIGGSVSEFQAIVDSGCHVTEPFSGNFVIIADKSCINSISLTNFPIRIIPYQSLGGNGILKGIMTEEASIDGIPLSEHIYIGLCSGIIKGDIKAIVPYELINKN